MQAVKRNDLTGQAYDVILHKIIDADYKPGQKISVKRIEEDVQIGRTPIREALLQLRQEGLINIVPQSGTYISKIDMKEVLDARLVRACVEQRIMTEATTKQLTIEQKTILQQLIQTQQIAMHNNDFVKFLTEDDQFHHYFYQITNHERIWDWLKVINVQFDRFRFLRLKVQQLSWSLLVSDHKDILNAVESNNIGEVQRITANHMHLMLKEESSLIKTFPDYFENYQSVTK